MIRSDTWWCSLLLLAVACATPPEPSPSEADHDTANLYEEVEGEPAEGAPLFAEFEQSNDLPYVLRGTIVTPDQVIESGRVLVEDGVIQEIWKQGDPEPPLPPGTVTIDTDGLILPGFIDLHNHVAYNFIPLWRSGTLFQNRYEWQKKSDYKRNVGKPYNAAKNAGLLDEMVKYGEIRALVGGTTSMLGAAQTAGAGILARNIDQRTLGKDLVRTHVGSVHEFGCDRGDPACTTQTQKVTALRAQLAGPPTTTMVFHVGEGIDPPSRNEFQWLVQNDLLVDGAVVTHGTAFTAAEFQRMGSKVGLVWSPRSNIELYGKTTDIVAAANSGVRIAIAPDWSPSGSDNVLAELRYAARYNTDRLGGFFSPKDLVLMATTVPAALARRGDRLGRIATGFAADLVVLVRRDPDPYRSVLMSDERHVQLVAVNGVPLFGRASWLEQLGKEDDFERITVRGAQKALDANVAATTHDQGQRFAEIRAALEAVLRAELDVALPALWGNDL